MRKSVSLVACLLLLVVAAGCSSGGNGSNSSSNNGNNPNPTPSISFATGQWEFVFGDAPSPSLYLEALFVPAGTNFSSGGDLFILPSQFNGPIQGGAIGSGLCGGFTAYVQNSGSSFTGSLVQGSTTYYTLNGTLSSDGKSISNGTFAVSNGNPLTVCSQPVPGASAFTAYWVPPVNGTYTGTLTPSTGPADQASIQISENVTLQMTMTGTVTGNGVVTTITVPASGSTTAVNVQGALFTGGGSATNANGTDGFSFTAHCTNSTCSQIYVRTDDLSTGVTETGTLNKQ
jgi:hypothetical protein